MELTPDKQKLVSLVELAYTGKYCLPEFQRDFVWSQEAIADLIRSVLRGYYIGSLLLLKCDSANPPFAPTLLRGATSFHAELKPEKLILDGQQRLTSLLYALTAPNLKLKDTTDRRWFFIDLQLLVRDKYNDDIVFVRSSKDLDGLDQPVQQYRQRILPCTYLISEFSKWMYGFDDWLRVNEPENSDQYRLSWRDSWDTAIRQFLDFNIPIVDLPPVKDENPESIGRVCAIFEKLNSTGVELSVYDLLTARLYRSGIRLHELWKKACDENHRLREWSKGKAETNKFGVLILRTLALIRGNEPKSSFLINLNPENFARDWDIATKAIERALELITHVGDDGFGVFNPKYLAGFGLLPVLAALRHHVDKNKLGDKQRSDLRRWYWCSVFLERYSSAVESTSTKDYREMLAYWGGAAEPVVFGEAKARIGSSGYKVRDSASHASSIYSGIFCLLALNGAKDWLRSEAIQLQKLEDHHIFPKNYLRKHGVSSPNNRVNGIINRTLISDETNRKISDKAPSEYLFSSDIFPNGNHFIMNSHFINQNALEAMKLASQDLTNDDIVAIYDEFLNERESMIIKEIRRVCGVETED